ncbi:hypothetical protein N8766_02675 [bacterium]|jgi:hypothetical protein|nr:hypothetical protein [Verrucomicrobiota bacterium]MDA7632990.1 hypothetical protein [bacterium]
MGVHHYKISLLPSVFFSEHLPKTLSDANVDHGQDPTTGWWATNPPTERLLAAVRTLLPKDNSWADGYVEEYVSCSEFGSDVRICEPSSGLKNQLYGIARMT